MSINCQSYKWSYTVKLCENKSLYREEMFVTLADPLVSNPYKNCIENLYRPPHTQVTHLISCINYFNTTISQFEARNETPYVCGDYNINLLLINKNINCSGFFECILGSGYIPSIILPTRLSDNSSLIDNIIYNKQRNLIFAIILENHISDHQTILINTVYRPPPRKSKYITIYNNSDASKENLRMHINSLNLYATLDIPLYSDLHRNYEIIESAITNSINIHLTKKK